MNEQIINYIKENLHPENKDLAILPQDDLLGSGLVESIGMMRLIQFIEKQFELKIPPQDLTIENFITVEAMVKYIEQSTS